MRASNTVDGVTLTVIAGTRSVILAMDLAPGRADGCHGFSIERTNLDATPHEVRWLPNMLRFKTDARDAKAAVTTATAPLQRFRWGDYTTSPATNYRYRIVPRYEATPAAVIAAGAAAEQGGATLPGGVSVDVRTEDEKATATSVIFNRGAAASKAYNDRFGDKDPAVTPEARVWLSRGLEEALLAFLGKASGPGWALHCCVYEFQKPELLAGLAAAAGRGAAVSVVYHARRKTKADVKADTVERIAAGSDEPPQPPAGAGADDDGDGGSGGDQTLAKNLAAIAAAGLDHMAGVTLKARAAAPSGGIMHDKYAVLLQGDQPVAVWTGSTNWTDGAIYGQLNVGHAVYDPAVAKTYEASFQLLHGDPAAAASKTGNKDTTPVPSPQTRTAIPAGVTTILSPQSDLKMIELYADVSGSAALLMVSAPFLVHEDIRNTWAQPSTGLRYVLADKAGSFGKAGAIDIFNRASGNVGVVATMLKDTLHDFQGALLEGAESFHHAGVHIHSKIILADPFGADPVLIMGSANFSNGSTRINDSNTLIFRGPATRALADIYAAEFMRMFEHYLFRYAQQKAGDATRNLVDDFSWSPPFFVPDSDRAKDRIAFVSAR